MDLVRYEKDNIQFKICSLEFYSYLSSIFKDISKNTVINEKENILSYECYPEIRGAEQKVIVELLFSEIEKTWYFDKITLTSSSNNLNEYDLSDLANTIIQKLFTAINNKQKQNYCVRNYCSYFNITPMQIDLTVHGAFKVRIHSYEFNSTRISTEPLTEQILMFDTELQAVDINEALSISYNNSNNLCSLLSVLFDIGFKLLKSEYRIFVLNTEKGLTINRYRTGFVDSKLGLSVKDNLNGLTTLLDGNKKFMGNVVISFLDENHHKIGSTIVQNQNDKGNIESIFLNNKIEKNTGSTIYSDEINVLTHFPANDIKVPRQIRNYIRNIEHLETNKKNCFIATARLYNLSLLTYELGATVSAAYRVSCIESLAKTENLSFSVFMQRYCTEMVDKKLLDYYYGTIRSGHFHSGEFYFNEYNITMQFDTDFVFSERKAHYLKFNNAIRSAVINWINTTVLDKE